MILCVLSAPGAGPPSGILPRPSVILGPGYPAARTSTGRGAERSSPEQGGRVALPLSSGGERRTFLEVVFPLDFTPQGFQCRVFRRIHRIIGFAAAL